MTRSHVTKSLRVIARSLLTTEYGLCWHLLPVICLPNLCHAVYENSCHVHSPSIFTCGVITWKDMVVIMKSFTNCSKCNKKIFCWVDVSVIGFVTPHMSCTVYCPGGIQRQSVTKYTTNEVTCPGTFSPKVPRHNRWYYETEKHHRWQVKPSIKQ